MNKTTSQTPADASAIVVNVANRDSSAVWLSTIGEFVENHHPSFNRPSAVIIQQIAAGLKSEGRYSVNVGDAIFTLTQTDPLKHTPGPWTVECRNLISGPNRCLVATVESYTRSFDVVSGEQQEANARLFILSNSEVFATPAQVATVLCDRLSVDDLKYCGDPARGIYRGFPALGDREDHNQLAVDAGMPELNGTPERIDLMSSYVDAISAEIISRYVATYVLPARR